MRVFAISQRQLDVLSDAESATRLTSSLRCWRDNREERRTRTDKSKTYFIFRPKCSLFALPSPVRDSPPDPVSLPLLALNTAHFRLLSSFDRNEISPPSRDPLSPPHHAHPIVLRAPIILQLVSSCPVKITTSLRFCILASRAVPAAESGKFTRQLPHYNIGSIGHVDVLPSLLPSFPSLMSNS